MKPEFNRVVIVGVGLIGGSLGMALCRRGLAREVVGTGSEPENLRLALELGAIHRFTVSTAGAVAGADLVIIATPVSATIPVLLELLPHLSGGAVVTDVGSTKGEVVREAERAVRPGISFVGGHPMSGSEKTGVRGADPYLFENAFYIITPTPRTPPAALESVRKLAGGVGARVLEMNPEEHDLAVSAVSHLPHLTAAALVNTAARAPGSGRSERRARSARRCPSSATVSFASATRCLMRPRSRRCSSPRSTAARCARPPVVPTPRSMPLAQPGA